MHRSLLLLATLCAGCHTTVAPEQVLATYFAHLREGRVAEAYVLTSAAYRAHHDLTAFALAAGRQPTLDARSVRRGELSLRVELSSPGAETVVLRGATASSLRTAEDPLDFYDVRSPEAALRSFARAVRCKRAARAAELVGQPLSQRWALGSRDDDDAFSQDVLRLAAVLEDELNRPEGLRLSVLNEGEAQARLELTTGDVIILSRGGTGWHLTDLP